MFTILGDLLDKVPKNTNYVTYLIIFLAIVKFLMDLVDKFWFTWRESVRAEANQHREVVEQLLSNMKDLYESMKIKYELEKDRADDLEERVAIMGHALDTMNDLLPDYIDIPEEVRKALRS